MGKGVFTPGDRALVLSVIVTNVNDFDNKLLRHVDSNSVFMFSDYNK